VAAAEFEKAKNQIITDQLRQRETSNGKALALGEAAVLLGDPARVNTDLARLQAVTAEDVQRVMKKYFTDQNRVVIYYLPESAKQAREVRK
jgi:zinc protease